jgi:acyl-[acyl-carrier-protein]-phospholipid O-acyltransferase/long-chain-fatty-acid--[acyl-carrier-protein] ligase
MNSQTQSPTIAAILIRWLARILGLAGLALVLVFMIGEGFNPFRFTARELALCACFPLAWMIGLLLAWRRELAGGLLTVGSILSFHAVHFATTGGMPRGWAFAVLAIPGCLFLVASLLSAGQPRPATGCGIAILRDLCCLLFRFRAFNEAVLRTPGPVLLLPNHTSWFDWLFLGVCLDGDWKFVTSSKTAETSPLHRWLMTGPRAFPVDPMSPYAARTMAEFLQKGGRLVLFPEGRISRTGSLMKLYDGTGFLLHKTGAKVITAYLRGAKWLPFSMNPDQKQLFPRVTVHFSELLTPPALEHVSNTEARTQLTAWLRDRLVEQMFRVEMEMGPATVPAAIAETARRRASRVALEDVQRTLTYKRLMQGSTLLAGALERRLGSGTGFQPVRSDEQESEAHRQDACATTEHIGVLLPNANALPVSLLALWSLGKVPAILNYTTGPAVMRSCCEIAGAKRVVTSRFFVARAKLNLAPLEEAGIKFIYLEDVRTGIGAAQKLGAALGFNRYSVPAATTSDTTAVVLFTSGSEGVPKAVALTHRNLLANIRQMLAIADMTDQERFFNALPLFHSFGLTGGALLPLVRGAFTFLYPSPLHYRVVPTVLYERDTTVFLATNTFLNGYARKANPYDFRALRYLFAGAEKVQEATAAYWAQRFGVRVLEGYGATECSPGICLNTPLQCKSGSAGRFLPDLEWKLEAIEGVAEGGRLLVRGPNVMKGYLNPDANAKFLALGGWYDTGDIVSVDPDGFVHILGRLKRFAKVSGEMVSLTAVEDALAGAFPDFGLRCQVAVVTRPDEDKGEKLIAVTNEPRLTLAQIREAVKAKGLTNLCVPREVVVVKEIPKLGTGKTNHRELQKMLS